jgi:hypothetical protein
MNDPFEGVSSAGLNWVSPDLYGTRFTALWSGCT